LKVSVKPTPNLEFGVSRTVLFAGETHGGLTLHTFWNAFSSLGDNTSTIPGSQSDVGDRRGEFDFHYRVPYLRNWVALYGDFMTDDDPSPLSAPHRSILAPGLELTKLPKLPRLQLRFEGISSRAAATEIYRGTFFYWNGAYHDGYTNRGNILGSWVGRDSTAIWGEARYWLSTRNTITISGRTVSIDPAFIPQGGHTTDFNLGNSLRVRRNVDLITRFQYERWNIPALATAPQHNFTTFVELRFSPRAQ
jgi:Capsule assembly protein Wzi